MRSTRRRLLRAWWRNSEGVSAVEFALFAPILFFGFLAMVDVGFALYDRMRIDSILRAGVSTAMANDEAAVRRTLEETAEKNDFIDREWCSSEPSDLLDLCATRIFVCPNPPATLPSCDGKAPYIYYSLEAEKPYEGIFIPLNIGDLKLGELRLRSSARVQVR